MGAALRLRSAMTSPGAGARRVTCATGRGRAAAVPLAGLTTWSQGQAHPTALSVCIERAAGPGSSAAAPQSPFSAAGGPARRRRLPARPQVQRPGAAGPESPAGGPPRRPRARCATQGRCAKLPRARARIAANSCRERQRFVTPLGQAQPSLPCDCTALPLLLLLLRRLPNRLDRHAPSVR